METKRLRTDGRFERNDIYVTFCKHNWVLSDYFFLSDSSLKTIFVYELGDK